jgi:hypothetical protein
MSPCRFSQKILVTKSEIDILYIGGEIMFKYTVIIALLCFACEDNTGPDGPGITLDRDTCVDGLCWIEPVCDWHGTDRKTINLTPDAYTYGVAEERCSQMAPYGRVPTLDEIKGIPERFMICKANYFLVRAEDERYGYCDYGFSHSVPTIEYVHDDCPDTEGCTSGIRAEGHECSISMSMLPDLICVYEKN